MHRADLGMWACTLAFLAIGLAAPASAQSSLFSTEPAGVAALADPPCGSAVISGLQDRATNVSQERSIDRAVSMDVERTLAGVVLIDYGAEDVSYESLRDVRIEGIENDTASTITDLDRDSVFSAISLGVSHAGLGVTSLEALACVSALTVTAPFTRVYERRLDLQQDDVMMAVTLANRGADPVDLEDIASIHETFTNLESDTQIVDLAREDALLALALGAG